MAEQIHPHPEYSVEISGWDDREDFFVERTNLAWTENNQKKILLSHQVRSGSIIFVRLLDSIDPPPSFPVAYRACQVQATPSLDRREVTLLQLWPQPGNRAPGNSDERLDKDAQASPAKGQESFDRWDPSRWH